MVKCCSFSAVKSFLWFWSLSNGTEAKQFLMILHQTDNLLSYFDEFFNLLYILFACVLLFTFVKIHTLGNYLVALFLLTQTNGKFKKRLRFVRVPHCSLGRCNFKRTLVSSQCMFWASLNWFKLADGMSCFGQSNMHHTSDWPGKNQMYQS